MSYGRVNGFGECSISPRSYKEVHNIRRTFHNFYILSNASLCTRTHQSILLISRYPKLHILSRTIRV